MERSLIKTRYRIFEKFGNGSIVPYPIEHLSYYFDFESTYPNRELAVAAIQAYFSFAAQHGMTWLLNKEFEIVEVYTYAND
jgi:hypothetical protein